MCPTVPVSLAHPNQFPIEYYKSTSTQVLYALRCTSLTASHALPNLQNTNISSGPAYQQNLSIYKKGVCGSHCSASEYYGWYLGLVNIFQPFWKEQDDSIGHNSQWSCCGTSLWFLWGYPTCQSEMYVSENCLSCNKKKLWENCMLWWLDRRCDNSTQIT